MAREGRVRVALSEVVGSRVAGSGISSRSVRRRTGWRGVGEAVVGTRRLPVGGGVVGVAEGTPVGIDSLTVCIQAIAFAIDWLARGVEGVAVLRQTIRFRGRESRVVFVGLNGA